MSPARAVCHPRPKNSHCLCACATTQRLAFAQHPLGAWLVTEIADERQNIIALESPGFDLDDVTSCLHRDTLCARLLRGDGAATARRWRRRSATSPLRSLSRYR
jgi:hypothetical protein